MADTEEEVEISKVEKGGEEGGHLRNRNGYEEKQVAKHRHVSESPHFG